MFLCLLALLFQPAGPARQHAERGYALAQRGEFKAAEAEAREAVRLAPESGNLALLGMVLTGERKFDEASGWFERALTLAPEDSGTRYNLAFVQVQLGRLDAARDNLKRILTREPDHKQAAALLAQIDSAGGFEQALSEYRRGRFAESEAALERLVAGGSRDPRVYNLLAWCRHRQGKQEEALAAARRAIEIAPEDAQWYANAAQILLENGMVQAAYGTAGKALSLNADSVHALRVKGAVEMRRSAFKQALETYRRAVTLDPADPEATNGLGSAQRMLYQYDDAAATFEKGIARFPRYAPMYQAYGELLLDPGAKADAAARRRAAELLAKALAIDSSLSQAHFALGKLLFEDGKAAEALPHLTAAAKLQPQSSEVHLALANVYRALGRAEDQARELRIYRERKAAEGGQK